MDDTAPRHRKKQSKRATSPLSSDEHTPKHAAAAAAAAAADNDPAGAIIDAAAAAKDATDIAPTTIDTTTPLPAARPAAPAKDVVEWTHQTPAQTEAFVCWLNSDVVEEEEAATLEYAARWTMARIAHDTNFTARVRYFIPSSASAQTADKQSANTTRVFKTKSVDLETGVSRNMSWNNLVTPIYRITNLCLDYHGNYDATGIADEADRTTTDWTRVTRGVGFVRFYDDTLLPDVVTRSQVLTSEAISSFQFDILVPSVHPDTAETVVATLKSATTGTNQPAIKQFAGGESFRIKSTLAHGIMCKSKKKLSAAGERKIADDAIKRAIEEWAVIDTDPVFYNKQPAGNGDDDDDDMPAPLVAIAKTARTTIAQMAKSIASGKGVIPEKVLGLELIPVCIEQGGVPVILSQESLVAVRENRTKLLAWAMCKPPHQVAKVPTNVGFYGTRIVLLSTRIRPSHFEAGDKVTRDLM